MFDKSSGDSSAPRGSSGRGSSPEVIARFDAWAEEVYGRREALSAVTAESTGWMERIGVAGRVANQGAAAQLVAIGELFGYRLARGGETDYWAADTMEAVTAEVAAGLKISQGLAASKLRYARELRERLPRVGEVFCAGDIDFGVFVGRPAFSGLRFSRILCREV